MASIPSHNKNQFASCRITMQREKWRFARFFIVFTALISQACEADSVVVPNSNCYAFDNASRLVDFTSVIGKPFEYDTGVSDLVIRFCKDIESRSQKGYVDFGRFDKFSYFVAGSGQNDYVQGFFNGDLNNCELSHDKMGRTAQVNIKCGSCPNGKCNGKPDCICNATFESNCRVVVDLSVQCETPGPRVFRGFTVGFHPRTWEIVYDGMTQLGFEKTHHDFSFATKQAHVSLYMTAIASLSTLVKKPVVKTYPEIGLEVKLSGSASSGNLPTTLSPTVLAIDWRCEKARDESYEVNITIPIEGYEPVQFVLTKMCEFSQAQDGNATRGWAIFGVLSCIFFVLSTLFCCGGFIYKTRVERQHGIEALPGMTVLSACLEAVSGMGQRYSRTEEINRAFASEASWDRPAEPPQPSNRQNDRKYGAI